MKYVKLNCLIIIYVFLVSSLKAQTYFWNNFPTATNSTVNWTPAAGNGGGTNQNNMSVNVVSSNGTRYYSYGTTSQYSGSVCGNATNGLLLEMSGGNWSNKITVTITFATPICGPISFNIQDINEDRWSGDNSSYFMDRISIGALDGVSTAITPANITVGGCSPTSTISGNNRVITAPAPARGTASTTLTSTTSASSPTYTWTGPGTIITPSAASTSVNGAGV